MGGAPADKPSRLVAPWEPVELVGPGPRFVSRGGDKLDGALEALGLDVTGLRVLDAGSSTGGFTDCLLQRGAARVVAVDVGRGQLDARLRSDPRVDVHERTHVRAMDIGEPVDLVCADLSFISLRRALPWLLAAVRPGRDLVLLVKPQFEADRAEAGRGRGVIRDPEVRERAVEGVAAAAEDLGAVIMGRVVSPLTGADGNVEIFLHLKAPG